MYETIKKTLQSQLKSERYIHSLGVADSCVALAKRYGYENQENAYLVGLLHDCAKNIPKEAQIKICEENDMPLDAVELITNGLIHAKTGAVLARMVFGITDPSLLDAIAYHCTGRENMTLLEKIVYLSDMIEPSRAFVNLEELRKLAFENLNDALIMQMNMTICFTANKNSILHPDTIAARNYLLMEKRGTLQAYKKMIK